MVWVINGQEVITFFSMPKNNLGANEGSIAIERGLVVISCGGHTSSKTYILKWGLVSQFEILCFVMCLTLRSFISRLVLILLGTDVCFQLRLKMIVFQSLRPLIFIRIGNKKF